MKKGLKIGALSLATLMVFGVAGCGKDKTPELPAARIDTCDANNYGATCSSITAENFDKYVGRSDVMYVDLRNFNDYTKVHLDGFEMVQFFADIYGSENQLFDIDKNNYVPRYKGSVEILEKIFPKDKTIFFMCQSGGRVKHMMKIMELNGWDMSRIYNIGGMQDFEKEEVASKYEAMIVAGPSYEKLTFKTATYEEVSGGHTYKTTASVAVGSNGKITNLYITGSEYTFEPAGTWVPTTWTNAKDEFVSKLVGKTLAEIKTIYGEDGADKGSNDVVTGATLSSNRVYKAIIMALEA